MQTRTPYVIGTEVSCADEVCGRLSRVVLDPVARELTHLVVEPDGRPDEARLVPIGLVDQDAAAIRLRCDAAGFQQLEEAQRTEFLPALADELGYPADSSLWMPYFPLGGAGGVAGSMTSGVWADAARSAPMTTTYERVPTGEVQVRRGQPVHATDGEIGKVQGLVIDPRDHQVTHVLLQEGHLWGRKQVALPIRNVTDVRQGVHLDLAKEQIRDLPPVDVEQFA